MITYLTIHEVAKRNNIDYRTALRRFAPSAECMFGEKKVLLYLPDEERYKSSMHEITR
jgi:hypothetical protein